MGADELSEMVLRIRLGLVMRITFWDSRMTEKIIPAAKEITHSETLEKPKVGDWAVRISMSVRQMQVAGLCLEMME